MGESSPSPAPQDLSALLTTSVPAGYTTPASGASPVDITAAAPSTFADPGRVRDYLIGNDYSGGYVHIFTHGPDYIDLLVFGFANPSEARGFVGLEVQQLRSALGADVEPESAFSGGYVFTLFGSTRSETRPVFCQGVWYPLQDYAFQVLTCSPQPGDTSLALSLTSLQYAQDDQALRISPAAAP